MTSTLLYLQIAVR